MIFSHMQKPLGMRIYGIPMRIYVQGVPLDASWFCPYCCATVDTAFVTPSYLQHLAITLEVPDRG
jgi:hypothetical protein